VALIRTDEQAMMVAPREGEAISDNGEEIASLKKDFVW